MQIQGNALFSVLGSLQPSAPGGAAPASKPAAETQARPAAKSAPTQSTATQSTATQGTAAQGTAAQSQAGAAGPSRAQELEQAVQTLSDQGRLPPRGSLVDLRA